MSSRSSNSAPEGFLPIGRVRGHRGVAGELTARVSGGDADQWADLRRVWIRLGDGGQSHESYKSYDVEHGRSYSDRLVLKLKGIDDPGAAEALRGGQLAVPVADAPPLEDGTYYAAVLVGMDVEDDAGEALGVVQEILQTGGTDVLVVVSDGGQELLIPLASGIVRDIDEQQRTIRVSPPEGLLQINAEAEPGKSATAATTRSSAAHGKTGS